MLKKGRKAVVLDDRVGNKELLGVKRKYWVPGRNIMNNKYTNIRILERRV